MSIIPSITPSKPSSPIPLFAHALHPHPHIRTTITASSLYPSSTTITLPPPTHRPRAQAPQAKLRQRPFQPTPPSQQLLTPAPPRVHNHTSTPLARNTPPSPLHPQPPALSLLTPTQSRNRAVAKTVREPSPTAPDRISQRALSSIAYFDHWNNTLAMHFCPAVMFG